MRIVTHNGHFHADELLAVATLLIKFPDAEVVRSRDEAVIGSADIVVDVGLSYDPAKFQFDHHQVGGAGVRENGVPYASFGLIWKEYGEEIAGGSEEARIIEEKLAMPIDAGDNGVDLYQPTIGDVREYSLGDFFESFAEQAESMEDYDRNFFEALTHARGLIRREIEDAKNTARDWREVQKIYDSSEDKRIIVLPRHAKWKRVLISTEAVYVVYPRPNGSWSSQVVPEDSNTYKAKKMFPEPWAGLVSRELAAASGVADAIFCHKAGFLVGAESREGAIALARKALEN